MVSKLDKNPCSVLKEDSSSQTPITIVDTPQFSPRSPSILSLIFLVAFPKHIRPAPF